MSIHRKTFIITTASTTAAIMLSSFEGLSKFSPVDAAAGTKGFQLTIMATNWGYTGSIDQYCALVKKEGYDGIEIWWPAIPKEQEELFAALKKYQLEVGFLCGGYETDPDDHLKTFMAMVTAATTQKIQVPVYINCHSGRDFFPAETNRAFIAFTIKQAKLTGIPIYHETHRSRILYAAHVAKTYMQEFSDLRITLDISHWCNVHESLLGDQPEAVSIALEKTSHIHCRVGHPEGPQVNDPRAPEWEEVVKQHVYWWDKVVERKKKAGERITILTEFGPPDYMPTLPYTRQPLADQWAINVHMLQYLRKRYQ
jgi:sugar phosphate isomerase/epimerase